MEPNLTREQVRPQGSPVATVTAQETEEQDEVPAPEEGDGTRQENIDPDVTAVAVGSSGIGTGGEEMASNTTDASRRGWLGRARKVADQPAPEDSVDTIDEAERDATLAALFGMIEQRRPPAPEPVAPELVAVEPVLPEPVAVEPVAVEPVLPEPVVPEPVAVEPVLPEPVAVEPVLQEPEPFREAVEEPEAAPAPEPVAEPTAEAPVVAPEPIIQDPTLAALFGPAAYWPPEPAEVPAPAAEVPAADVEVPAPAAELPVADVEVPAPVAEVPAPAVEVPAPAAEVPVADVEVPAPAAEVPAPAAEVPVADVEVPAPAADVPAPAAEMPAPAAEMSVADVEPPAPVAETPARSGRRWRRTKNEQPAPEVSDALELDANVAAFFGLSDLRNEDSEPVETTAPVVDDQAAPEVLTDEEVVAEPEPLGLEPELESEPEPAEVAEADAATASPEKRRKRRSRRSSAPVVDDQAAPEVQTDDEVVNEPEQAVESESEPAEGPEADATTASPEERRKRRGRRGSAPAEDVAEGLEGQNSPPALAPEVEALFGLIAPEPAPEPEAEADVEPQAAPDPPADDLVLADTALEGSRPIAAADDPVEVIDPLTDPADTLPEDWAPDRPLRSRRARRRAARAKTIPVERARPMTPRRRAARAATVAGILCICAAVPFLVPAIPATISDLFPDSTSTPRVIDPVVDPATGGFNGPVGIQQPGGPLAGRELVSAGAPLQVVVPRLKVDSPVVPISGQSGELLPPDDPQVLGWWQEGRGVGAESGSAVVTGHTVQAGGGAFDNLGELVAGDTIQVRTETGWISYVVSRSRNYSTATLARDAASIFTQQGPGRLVLITCSNFNGKVYLSNAVVYAVPVLDEPFVLPPSAKPSSSPTSSPTAPVYVPPRTPFTPRPTQSGSTGVPNSGPTANPTGIAGNTGPTGGVTPTEKPF